MLSPRHSVLACRRWNRPSFVDSPLIEGDPVVVAFLQAMVSTGLEAIYGSCSGGK